ncbi:MAG: prephenate dehydratase [SAR202 cluster bacterium]|nr:prephenate dehydratase [SAR202 cluster bacterium]
MTNKRISFLGPAGTYSEQAAQIWCGECDLVSVDSIPDVAQAVNDGRSEIGIVPIENSIEGGVTFTLDLLIHDSDLSICGEIVIPINHNLMSKNEINYIDIKTVYSHPQSLGQCRQFLASNLPNANLVASLSNSAAVEEMMNSPINSAAISSDQAAKIYGAKILQKNVEDRSNNETRFIVLGKSDHPKTGNDKTSLCFEFQGDQPGILSESLTEFASRDINLVKIESRPNKKSLGRYVFLVDIEGHRTDQKVTQSINALSSKVAMIKILGSYPKFI